MNENETQELYQRIFSQDRLQRWESWQRDGNTAAGMRPSITHPLAEISKTKWRWKHGISYMGGRRFVRLPSHPRASMGKHKYVLEHILVVESVIGRFLSIENVVHHVNEIKDDNRRQNLVVLESQAAHQELHGRLNAYKACGHADWLKCNICHQYDDPVNLYVWSQPASETDRAFTMARHRACHARSEGVKYHTRKAQLTLVANGV